MVNTIAPVVYGEEGSDQQSRWLRALLFYTTGAVGAALGFGILLGFLGQMLPLGSFRPLLGATLIGSLCLLYALHELQVVRLFYPQWRRQVPSGWRRRFHPYATAALFGAQLGVGYLTYVPVATLYIVTVAAVIYGSPVYGALIFALFGLGRAGALLPLAWPARTQGKAYRISTRLMAVKPLVHLFNGWALAFAGAYLLTILIRAGVWSL